MRRTLVALPVALAVGLVASIGGAEPEEPAGPGSLPVPVITLDALPLGVPTGVLAPESRIRAETVLGRTIFAQRVVGIRYRSREDVFLFLLDHPDFAASVARALDVGQYRLTPRDDGYWGDDARGATGMVRLLHADDGRRLYHLEGRYEQKRLPTIEGQLLVLLEFRHEEDLDGGTVVESSLTGHLRIDTPVIGTVAQLVGVLTRPLVERAVERKVRRFFRTVARVSRWAYDQPELLAALLDAHPEMPSGPTLASFQALLRRDLPPGWARLPYRLVPAAEP
jgi:hypothetical protein